VTTRRPGIRAISIASSAALVLGLALTTAPAAGAAATPQALVVKPGTGTKGERSVRVRAVQHALQRNGFRVHRADGRFGGATRRAVRRFQRRAGLRVDGVVGTRTRQALGLTAQFTRVHLRRARARQVAAKRRAIARHRAAALADRRRVRATPAPRKAIPDAARVVAPTVHAAGPAVAATVHAAGPAVAPTVHAGGVGRAAPAPEPAPGASGRHGLPGGSDLAALAILIVIATWLLVRQAAPRPGRRALALGGGGAIPLVGAPAGAPGAARAVVSDGGGGATPHGGAAIEEAASTGPPRRLAAGTPVIAYVDTSAGVGGRAAKKIERTCARAGWDLVEVVAERGDRRAGERAGLAYAIERIEKGEAGALVIRDLADLGRRGVARAALTRRVRNAGAALVTCVPGGTPVIEQRSERAGRAGRADSGRRRAHDLRRRLPGTTPRVSSLHEGQGTS
jgi:hypothetical protein